MKTLLYWFGGDGGGVGRYEDCGSSGPGVGEEVSVGDAGEVGVGDAGVGAEACENGDSVGDDGGSRFGVDREGCVVGDAY